ncbi:hypothetical protein [Zavarzinella formosa]|uniref:hypothetical protein n=1 Tax=Zavarzinella formosa TaxID=360055 RepID=UPI0002DA8DC4|nr:hypothetical protein [Zavarzinella formosa]
MSVTIADGQLAAIFARVAGPVEVRSPDGRVLGMFTPQSAEPVVSPEEIERLLADPKTRWHTVEEVQARLRELRCSP